MPPRQPILWSRSPTDIQILIEGERAIIKSSRPRSHFDKGPIGYRALATILSTFSLFSLLFALGFLISEPLSAAVTLITLFFLLIGVIFLCLADVRHFDFYIDKANETIFIRKKTFGTRLSGWSWSQVSFASLTIEPAVRSFWTQEEGSPAVNHYFSGYEITLTSKGKSLKPIFLEHSVNKKNSPDYVPPSIRSYERYQKKLQGLATFLDIELTMPKDVRDA